jgi:hypothetical protein
MVKIQNLHAYSTLEILLDLAQFSFAAIAEIKDEYPERQSESKDDYIKK